MNIRPLLVSGRLCAKSVGMSSKREISGGDVFWPSM